MINRGNTANKTDMSERVRSTAHDGMETAKDVATTAANQAAALVCRDGRSTRGRAHPHDPRHDARHLSTR